ncbi:alpha/beta hydrolase [bacterium]|nr:alpha/beta hydrolase [candidate division CSSED10-310 bacterium]
MPQLRHTVEHGMFIQELDGLATRPPVLYLHGLGESGLCFERIVTHSSLTGWRHLIPDLPGYGRSAWPDKPLTGAAVMDSVAEWLRRRGETRLIVVGHSLGGVLALLFCERHPDLVQAVIDVEGNKSPGDCTYSGQAAAHDLAKFTLSGFDALRDEVYRLGIDDPAHRGYYASLRLAHPATFHLHAAELVTASAEKTLAERLRRLQCPKFYIAGSPSGSCEESLDLLAAHGVPCISIMPSGHWPFIDQPDQFAAAISGIFRVVSE